MKIFWAWQSDLPGKISRYFVRDALQAAIEKLKQIPDIEEPSEESRRNEVHLDSDRQGLSGSPDLARAILNKIDASSVFVGDVTPVGHGVPTVTDEVKREGKPLMNPNVAIELGYALAKLGDQRILMILNTAYGNREGLPFDIRHKAGPILYEMTDGATNHQIKLEKAKLSERLFEAIRNFKSVEEPTASLAFNENLPKIGKALFFEDGEILASSRENSVNHKMSSRSVFYLRVIPAKALDMPLAIGMLLQRARDCGAFSHNEKYYQHEQGYGYIRENNYGVLDFNCLGEISSVGSLTQYFRNGEIWGINAEIIRGGEGDVEKYVPSQQVEHTIAESLNLYLEFQREVNQINPPYTVEAGLHGVKGRILTNPGGSFNKHAKFSFDSFELRRVLNNAELSSQDKFLFEIFELMHNQTGYPRPPKLYGFPPDRSGAAT